MHFENSWSSGRKRPSPRRSRIGVRRVDLVAGRFRRRRRSMRRSGRIQVCAFSLRSKQHSASKIGSKPPLNLEKKHFENSWSRGQKRAFGPKIPPLLFSSWPVKNGHFLQGYSLAENGHFWKIRVWPEIKGIGYFKAPQRILGPQNTLFLHFLAKLANPQKSRFCNSRFETARCVPLAVANFDFFDLSSFGLKMKEWGILKPRSAFQGLRIPYSCDFWPN